MVFFRADGNSIKMSDSALHGSHVIQYKFAVGQYPLSTPKLKI